MVTDQEANIIKGCISGDRASQKELYRLFAPKMMSMCLRYTRNREDAEDFMQDGFIKIYNSIHTFRMEGSFEGWIRRIIMNVTMEFYRKKGKEFLYTSQYDEIEELHAEELDPDNDFNKEELLKAIQELSPGYRIIFNLYAIEGYSHKEIAVQLGISEGTSKSQLSRAKIILQKRLNEINVKTYPLDSRLG